MSSTDEEVASGVADEKENSQAAFLALIKGHQILFDKSQTPAVKKLKHETLEAVKDTYAKTFGEEITVSQLLKKINNMKSRLKIKTDTKSTGNRKIQLKAWESELLKLMDGDTNPVINKIPGMILCIY